MAMDRKAREFDLTFELLKPRNVMSGAATEVQLKVRTVSYFGQGIHCLWREDAAPIVPHEASKYVPPKEEAQRLRSNLLAGAEETCSVLRVFERANAFDALRVKRLPLRPAHCDRLAWIHEAVDQVAKLSWKLKKPARVLRLIRHFAGRCAEALCATAWLLALFLII